MKILYIANYKENSGGISNVVKDYLCRVPDTEHSVTLFNTKRSNLVRPFLILVLIFKIPKADIIHIHGCSYRGFFPITIGILASKLYPKKRLIISYHGGGAKEYFQKQVRVKRWFLKQADKVVVMSPYLNSVFKDIDLETIIIPNGINIPTKQPKTRKTFKPNIISLRSLSKNYNIKDIIMALQIIQKDYPEASLSILGDGPDRTELENYTAINKIHNITFFGRVNRFKVLEHLSKNDIFVSVPTFDNQPLSILEAFAECIPVIVTAVGGVKDIVIDSYNGLLIAPNSPGEIAGRISWLLTHQEEGNEIVKNAFDGLYQYSWDSVLQKLKMLYS
ncbi:MAG: glycosyltransferase family 4 protein [Clostridia bacterium]|nr:glycosyltransferase family 4 protein [Clostridia bacterium]HPE57654.1 glycosyltransferase family 4 protein [Bacteroidales bacterium]